MQNLWNQKFKYKNISRVTDKNGARYYSCEGNKVPSVTTILDKTKSQKDKDSLNSWKEKVGHAEAYKIAKASMLRGDKMHKYLEDALHGKQTLDFDEEEAMIEADERAFEEAQIDKDIARQEKIQEAVQEKLADFYSGDMPGWRG